MPLLSIVQCTHVTIAARRCVSLFTLRVIDVIDMHHPKCHLSYQPFPIAADRQKLHANMF